MVEQRVPDVVLEFQDWPKRGRYGSMEFPPTEGLARLIREGGFSKWKDLCAAMDWNQSTLCNHTRERGDRELLSQVILDNAAQEIHQEEAYTTNEPEALEADMHNWHTSDDLQGHLNQAQRREAAVARENQKLRALLYDKRLELKLVDEAIKEGQRNAYRPGQQPKRIEFVPVEFKTREPQFWHVPIADLHAGKYVYGKASWGEDYDTKLAAKRLEQHGYEVARIIRQSPAGYADVIYQTDLGDLFHAIDSKTESGTRLHQDTRGTRVIAQTTEARMRGLEAMAEVADKIIIKSAVGNHDHLWNYYFYRELHAWYHDHPKIDVQFNEAPEDYFIVGHPDYGYSPHVIVHGKGVGKLNTPAVIRKARIDCDEIVKEASPDGNKFKRFYYYCAHFHHEEKIEEGRYLLRRLPSMSENDDYEQGLHVMSFPKARVFHLDGAGREIDSKTIHFDSAAA